MVVERYRKCLEAGDFTALADVYAQDAVLDANVPSWRLQRQGSEAIVRQFEEWYQATPPRFVGWHERPTGWGKVVELETRLGEGEGELYFREAHLFVTADERITQHVFYCTGPWDAETIARHQAAEGSR